MLYLYDCWRDFQIDRLAEHILEQEKQTGNQLLTDEERAYATSYVIFFQAFLYCLDFHLLQ